MTKLKDLFKYKLPKVNDLRIQLKENSDDQLIRFRNELEKFHACMEKCIENYNYMKQFNGSLKERLYLELYNEIYVLCGGDNLDNKPEEIKKCIDTIYDETIELRNELERYAYDSGSYHEYDEDTYNSEKTHNAATDYGLPEIMRQFFNNRMILEIGHEAAAKSLSLFDNDFAEQSEPEFSGDFDEIQVVQSRKETEELKNIRTFVEKIVNADKNTDTQEIIRLIDYVYNQSNSAYIDYYDNLWYIIRDNIFDIIDDNYSEFNDSEWVKFDEGEFNNDATWERIYEVDTSELMNDFLDFNDVEHYLRNIIKPSNILFRKFDLPAFTFNNEKGYEQEQVNDDESDIGSGSEFDE